MQNWLLQTLSDVLSREENPFQAENKVLPANQSFAELKAQREWFGAIAATENLLAASLDSLADRLASSEDREIQGLVFSSPVPVFSDPNLVDRLQTGVFTPEAFQFKALLPAQLEPEVCHHSSALWKLPLIPNDPIIQEQFCLIFTEAFALVLLLGRDLDGVSKFYFSFDPETVSQAWQTLRSRLKIVNYQGLPQLDTLVASFPPPVPDYRLVSSFSRQLLVNLPNLTALAIEKTQKTRQLENINLHDSPPVPADYTSALPHPNSQLEMELLQALTHEIRTPLTTIRTLTKLLLKKKRDFSAKVVDRLQTIERECTEQIERMELIFRAVELESAPIAQEAMHLTPCCLETLLQQTIPRWEQQAQRRNVSLDVTLPHHLPQIVSDPAMLDKALTGLMESCTRSIATGGEIMVNVSTAGDRLKLQVISQCNHQRNPFKSLGQLLMFQPDTGCLSLNWDVTKNMFQALGGKLTVRQRSKQGKELTIFLPLGKKINNLG